MEKIIRQDKTFIAHNSLLASPDNISALERALVHTVYAQLKDSDDPRKIYTVSIRELQEKLEQLGWRIDMDQIDEATSNLLTRIYYIIDPAGRYVYVSLFGSVTFTDGSDIIKVRLSNMIRPYLFHLQENDYTMFALDTTLSLKNRYSQLIYQMLCQHMKDGFFYITIEDLKHRLFPIDPKNPFKKLEMYKTWSPFWKEILVPAQKEINAFTNMNFTCTLHKTGRKYTAITFHINHKREIKYQEGLFIKS